ncbi:MAG: hypothetical protein ACP5QO_06455 [Clostridia bacterium]
MDIISPTLVQDGWLQQVSQLQEAIGQTQEQAATGLAFTTPAENPVGTAAVIALSAQETQARDLQTSQTTAGNVLQVVTGGLTGITGILQQAEQLAISVNSPASGSTAGAAVAEAQALVGQLTALLNTQADGYYVFAASDPTQPVASSVALLNAPSSATVSPWSWELPVAPGLTTPISINGFEAGVMVGSVSGFSVALQALNALVAEIPGASTATAQGQIQTALDAITTANAVAGTYQDLVQQGQNQMQTWLTTLETQVSTTQSANMVQVASQMATEQAVYQAALQAGNMLIQADLWTVIKP